MRKEERVFLLQNGRMETYRTDDGRPVRLFYGPYSVYDQGSYVGKRGYAVDVDGNARFGPARNWFDTIEAADRALFALRAKNEIDIAREALRLPIVNDGGD